MTLKPPADLKASFAYADQVMAQASKSFYQAFSLLPKDRFLAVTALYAFNRYVDDVVDEDLGANQPADIVGHLEDLADNLDRLETDQAVAPVFADLAWWPAFAWTVRTYGIEISALKAQIKGQLLDMADFKVTSLADLVYYSQHVAGSVGLMMLPILVAEGQDARDPDLRAACQDLGVGMQFTNILRDVGEDYRDRGRIYLPRDLMAQYGVDAAMISQLSQEEGADLAVPPAFAALWEDLAGHADHYYQGIFNHLPAFHPRARLPLAASALIYHGIQDAVRANGYNCLTQRNYTSKLDRLRLIKKAQTKLKGLSS
ncbi:hypothetical protein AWM75_08050 [Aerococcus urinaehominis]|uniref:Uncharacterized protein n=1 Tax=Aerococcus urinaehominis TaxID=128944 RepID=A0A120IB27_9LACT|nr:phytoene/squalene synthase family protein [Aerococcus urinaehominis]AMB99923.1 hypothetical protein AWM75_08050 [Aerococcus urinaehominis]SDM43303.1 phytoene synthase [Aerococcus urinaehominis]